MGPGRGPRTPDPISGAAHQEEMEGKTLGAAPQSCWQHAGAPAALPGFHLCSGVPAKVQISRVPAIFQATAHLPSATLRKVVRGCAFKEAGGCVLAPSQRSTPALASTPALGAAACAGVRTLLPEPAAAPPPANAQLLLAEVRAGDSGGGEGGQRGWVSRSQHPRRLARPAMERWLVLACRCWVALPGGEGSLCHPRPACLGDALLPWGVAASRATAPSPGGDVAPSGCNRDSG